LLAYAAAIAAFATPTLASTPSFARKEALPLLVAVVLPLVVFERDWHAHKRWGGESAFFDVVHELVKMQGSRGRDEPLVLDHYSCAVFRYYLSINPDYKKLSHQLAHRFARTCPTHERPLTAAEHQASDRRVWLVFSDPHDGAATLDHIASVANMVDYRELDDGRGVLLELAPPGWRAR
jgi:hypothetical protein